MLLVPSEMGGNIIRMVHENICHQGIEKFYEKIRKNYWFSHMKQKISQFIQKCIKCTMFLLSSRSNDDNLFSIPKKLVPFDTIDHFGPLPCIKSKRIHILVIIDAFTKFIRLNELILQVQERFVVL